MKAHLHPLGAVIQTDHDLHPPPLLPRTPAFTTTVVQQHVWGEMRTDRQMDRQMDREEILIFCFIGRARDLSLIVARPLTQAAGLAAGEVQALLAGSRPRPRSRPGSRTLALRVRGRRGDDGGLGAAPAALVLQLQPVVLRFQLLDLQLQKEAEHKFTSGPISFI